jgi:hypothetical protein
MTRRNHPVTESYDGRSGYTFFHRQMQSFQNLLWHPFIRHGRP